MVPQPNTQIRAIELRNILSNQPLSLPLLARTMSHFAPRLEFYLQEQDVKHSSVTYHRSPGRDELERIVITVHPDPTAIVHELLHLDLTARGFPLQFAGDLGHKIFADEASKLQNSLSHAVFLNDFLSIGFDRMELTHDSKNPDDIPKLEEFLGWVMNHPYYGQHARGLFNRLYFEQFIADRLGFPNSESEFLRLGQSRFSAMDVDARWLAGWFGRGDFRNPILFPKAMNQMLTEIGLQPVQWRRVDVLAGHLLLVDIP